MYAFMIRWQDMKQQSIAKNIAWPMGNDPQAVLADYKARAARIGITRVSEPHTFDKLEEMLKLPR